MAVSGICPDTIMTWSCQSYIVQFKWSFTKLFFFFRFLPKKVTDIVSRLMFSWVTQVILWQLPAMAYHWPLSSTRSASLSATAGRSGETADENKRKTSALFLEHFKDEATSPVVARASRQKSPLTPQGVWGCWGRDQPLSGIHFHAQWHELSLDERITAHWVDIISNGGWALGGLLQKGNIWMLLCLLCTPALCSAFYSKILIKCGTLKLNSNEMWHSDIKFWGLL